MYLVSKLAIFVSNSWWTLEKTKMVRDDYCVLTILWPCASGVLRAALGSTSGSGERNGD